MIKVNLLTKAQITAFILIGIIVFILFLFLYFISNTDVQVKLTTKMEKIASDILYSETVRIYTTNCIDTSLNKGLILMGQQGGFANKTFLQSLSAENYVPYEGGLIKTWIMDDYERPYPQYPCPAGYPSPFYCEFTNTEQFLESTPAKIRFGIISQLNKGFLERELEKYLEQETPKCTNFTGLLDIDELAGTEIIEQTPVADVRLTTDDIKVEVEYPLTIGLSGKEPVIFLLNFNAKSDIRLLRIMETIIQQTTSDSIDLNYNLSNSNMLFTDSGESFRTKLPGAQLGFIKRADADIVVITDPVSKIGPDFYVFRYARANRPPALNYVQFQGDASRFDYQAQLGVNIGATIIPNATDPDEDSVTYTFTDWKANGETTFNYLPVSGDEGLHELTLTAEDEHGSKDSQIIRILVCSGGLGEGCDLGCQASQECVAAELDKDILPYQFSVQNTGCTSQCIYVPCEPSYVFDTLIDACRTPGTAEIEDHCVDKLSWNETTQSCGYT